MSGALGPASSVKSAKALDYTECAKDWVTGALFETFVDYLMENPNHCLEITDGDHTKTTRTDQYEKWRTWENSRMRMFDEMDNRLQDSRSVAMTKAKIAIVNELNNGSDMTTAQQAGHDAIQDYYATMEYNLLQEWNLAVVQMKYSKQVESGTTGSTGDWVRLYYDSTVLDDKYVTNESTKELTLINGTSATYYYPTKSDEDNPRMQPHPGMDGSLDYGWRFVGPDSSVVVMQYDNGDEPYRSTFNEIISQSNQAEANIDTYVEEIYDNFSAGEIEAEDLVKNDPTLLYQEASTDKDSTGYYGYAAVQLAALGYAGNLEASHVVTVNASSENSTTYEGTLFYTGDDIESIETGSTIDTSEHGGLFMMAVQNESTAEIKELNGNLTIESATNVATGEEVENTTIERKVYNTTSTESLAEEIAALQELREQYESQATYAGSGGGGGIDVGFDLGGTEAIAVIAVVGGALLLAGRRD